MTPWEEQPTEDPTMPGAGMRCGDHAKVEKEIEDMEGNIGKLFALVGDCITTSMFKWMVGLIFLCIIGLLGFQGVILSKVSAVDKSVAVIQGDVNHIQQDLKQILGRKHRDSD